MKIYEKIWICEKLFTNNSILGTIFKKACENADLLKKFARMRI